MMSEQDFSKPIARAWLSVQRPVYAYVASMVSDHAEVDDLVQQVAMAMIDDFERYDPSKPLLGWALGIARHKVLNYYRQRDRDRHVFSAEAMKMLEQAYQRLEYENEEIREALAVCLASLTGKQKQTLQMRYGMGLKPAAISKQMGLKAPVVSNLLARARQSLRRCIERRLGDRSLEAGP